MRCLWKRGSRFSCLKCGGRDDLASDRVRYISDAGRCDSGFVHFVLCDRLCHAGYPEGFPEMTEYLTVEQTAKLLQYGKTTLYTLLRQGKIPGAVRLGGSWRIYKPTLERGFAWDSSSAEMSGTSISASMESATKSLPKPLPGKKPRSLKSDTERLSTARLNLERSLSDIGKKPRSGGSKRSGTSAVCRTIK